MNIDKLIKRKQHAKRDSNFQQLAEITKDLGDMYFENEQPTEALQEYTEQLSICEKLQDKLNCAIAHRMIGEVHASWGDYERALIHQNLHLEGARDIKNLIEEQRAFATLGRTYFCLAESLTDHLQKRDEALANAKLAYMNSMELCDKLTGNEIKLQERTLMRARLLLNLGLTLEAQKETQQAINLIEQATELCVANNFQEDLHRTCISLAAIYERQGNHELALTYIETAATVQDVHLKTEAKMSKAELLIRTGKWIETRKILISLYTSKGLPKDIKHQVEKYLRIIVTLCRAENDLLVETNIQVKQKLYETLGDAAVAAQCFDKGAEYYRHMLTCAEKTGDQVSISLVSLAQTLKDAGRHKEALPYAQRELGLCTNPREKCRSGLFLADLLIAANAPDIEIRECYTLALTSANESDNVKLQRSVARELVSYLESTNQFDEAKDTRQKAGLTSDEAPSDTESEAVSEESGKIGADICLEELSDLEDEENIKTITKRRTRTATIKRNAKGETQLHVACINGDVGTVEKLLSSGHSTNVRDHCGWSPLHEAANHGFVDIAELLLRHGANINDPGGVSCKGVTPLHDAACCGHFSMMQLLIQHGANVTLKTHGGDTVLDCLEDWKDRVGELSPEDLVEYDMMYKKLSTFIPIKRKRNRSDNAQMSDKESVQPPNKESEVEKISASEYYKRTIENLRSFNKNNAVVTFKDDNDAPLVSEEQVLIDDWLEDDIGSTTKKKSISYNHIATGKRKSNENIDSTTKKLKLNCTLQNEEYLNISDEDSAEANDEDSVTTEIIQLSEESKRIKRKRQTSLISNGFIVSRSPSPLIHELQSSSRTPTAFESQQDAEYIHLHIFIKEDAFDLKVAVYKDEEEFLKCITTAAESMFFRETACTVKLLLRPINGNVTVTKESILKVAVEENARLECEIVELRIPSIVERYKTICHIHDSSLRDNMLSCLKSCENTSILRTRPDDIAKELIVPLLKTLKYEKNITLLQLSGTVLGTAGTHLHRCLSNLLSLQELYLKNCDIDFACLRQINSLPPQLRVLDLSYNPLSSESRDILRDLIVSLRYLRTLNLRYCKLEDFHVPFDNPNLTNCDISWNKLNRDTMIYFLNKQLLDLNLSNTTCSDKFVSSLVTSTVLLPNLELLDLSFCDITDSDVQIILAHLPKLLKLIIRGNTNVTVSSINVLLSRRPTLTYIDVSGCKNIASSPERELIIQNPEVCTLLANMEPNLCDLWIKLWRGAGIVTKLPHNLAIFKPIKSFAENDFKV
ncbi:tonsoku-like protein [Cataglyphis hispanica]|uniref:tonsoku-like protein n=1 Tax=Cataglyphis hispanica TaxID=1086592 RepID=UPI0021806B50|nr:tonsoku-like protein [Cataglyphis hispanica]